MIENGISLLTNRDKFQKLIQYTQEKTGFTSILLEKDFYLTLVLNLMGKHSLPLIFKGGTCLNKCHLGYYRLSEDLDFVYLNTEPNTRTKRRTQFSNIEDEIKPILSKIPGLTIGNMDKFDEHRQGRMIAYYNSVFNGKSRIQIEITNRNPLRLTCVNRKIRHCFKDPFTNTDIIDSIELPCMAIKEVAAEKIRACFTRQIPAIRDFFDIWYLFTQTHFDFSDPEFTTVLRQKLNENSKFVDLNQQQETLKRQVRQELLPTISENYDFDLDKTIRFVQKKFNACQIFSTDNAPAYKAH